MICVACGVENEPGRKFCSECGDRLSAACAACGTTNAPDAKFCGECGAPLGGPSAAAAAPANPQATERRLVSVLFVDLVGFTPFSEAHDAEDVRAMLGRYFDEASAAVARHGGIVEKFIGDAVMAVWGTPVAHEDDAERAVRSALEVVDRVEALGHEIGEPLRARAGVLTGEAVAALGAVDQGLVTGDLVNTASRLQSAAAPGTVLVGERTYRAASAAISFEPVEPLALKGKQERLAAWRALRLTGERGGSGRGAAPEPPFVGRDEELRLAKELLHATGRDDRPRLLHVSGVAGIGKSRLVWELRKYTDGLTEDIFWHQGRCPAYGDGIDFWAFADMVRRRAGIADSDLDDVARGKLAACLESFVADADERSWLEPRLGHLLGLEAAPAGDKDELYGAWRRFVERVAERGTTVLVFEDLHWADPGLLDFIESLLEWSRTSPVLVLTLARPELYERRPSWGAGVRSSTGLHLEPLADEAMAAMVAGYVEGLPAAGLARIVARAEGVPMYAVETVRMLADRGVLEQDGSAYRMVGDLGGELDIPETLQALVAARLDGLTPAERVLVQDASVAGHSFTLEAVCTVGGHEAADAEATLRALVRKEVLDQDADPRSPERGQYRFVQAVIQEVAYATLSKVARRGKHLACATWFAALEEDDLAGVVASHFLEAYRAEPAAPDAAEVAGRARRWLRRAAERASSLGSQEQAEAYATTALSLADDPLERQGLHLRAGLAAAFAGHVDDAMMHLREGRQPGTFPENLDAEIALLTQLSRSSPALADLAVVHAGLRDLINRYPAIPEAPRSVVLSALASAAGHEGRTDDAMRYSDEAIMLAQRWPDERALREATAARALALRLAGRRFEAQLLYESYVDQAARSGSTFEQASAYMLLGVFLYEEDPRGGVEASLRAAELADIAGVRPLQGMALANAAEGAVDVGDWDVAEGALEQADAIDSAGYEADGRVLTRCMLLAHRARSDEARALLDDLRARRWDAWAAVQMRSWYVRVNGLCLLLAGDDRGAADEARRLVDDFEPDANTSGGLWLAGAAGAALRDADAIDRFVQGTASLGGPWVERSRRTLRAGADAIGGGPDAPAAFDAVLDEWSSAELPLDHAMATLVAVRALPSTKPPAGHLAQARTYLDGLGGVALLALLDEATIRRT